MNIVTKKWALLFLALVLFTPALAAQAKAPLLFCEQVDQNWDPIDPANSFDTNTLNIIYQQEQAFGMPSLVFSVYAVMPNGEEILYREEMPINPEWNFFLLRDVVFPQTGTYKLSYVTVDGEPLAEGVVEVRKVVTEVEAMPETIESDGKTLKEIFMKYKPE